MHLFQNVSSDLRFSQLELSNLVVGLVRMTTEIRNLLLIIDF